MLRRLWTYIEDRERKLRRSFGRDITTPKGRFWAKVHYHVFDHAFLRILWTNFYQIAPGVYRSNHPTHARFEKYAAMGIKTVVNLRGTDPQSFHILEVESCAKLGLTLINTKLHARDAPSRRRLLEVISALRAAERPMMFHCKSGADRAGMVAAMYLMIFENVPVAEAKQQLSLKYLHLKSTATGIQDYILDVYEARTARAPIGFEDWIATEYDKQAIKDGWALKTPPDQVIMPA